MRRILFASVVGAALVVAPRPAAAQAPPSLPALPNPPAAGVASLEDRLKTGLRVRAPRETRFIETIALRVREGRLPAKLVDSTYIWAIQRGKKYPFPAFEHVIRLQAERLNVPLDPR
jgi:hypothetical protein